VGQPHNITVVRYLFEYLEREISWLAKVAWANADKPEPSSVFYVHPRTFKTSFCRGAVEAIWERLEQQFDKDRTATTESTALVTRSESALAEAVKKLYPNIREGSPASFTLGDPSAQWAGYQAGMKIPIHQGVAHAKGREQLR
jgi:hypothetical protein